MGYGVAKAGATGQRFDQVLAEKSKQHTLALEGQSSDKTKELRYDTPYTLLFNQNK